MSIKQLLGLDEAGLTDAEIMGKILEAERQNLDEVEFDVDGDIVKISIPHVGFDPNADVGDTW